MESLAQLRTMACRLLLPVPAPGQWGDACGENRWGGSRGWKEEPACYSCYHCLSLATHAATSHTPWLEWGGGEWAASALHIHNQLLSSLLRSAGDSSSSAGGARFIPLSCTCSLPGFPCHSIHALPSFPIVQGAVCHTPFSISWICPCTVVSFITELLNVVENWKLNKLQNLCTTMWLYLLCRKNRF